MQGRFVSYLRVSTDRQGKSGLGLEAQRAAVTDYLNGGSWKLIGEMVEIESGKRTVNRPQLAAAMALCDLTGARLVVAKLDRLSRDGHFLLGLEKAGVDFVATNMPNANKLTVGIMALVAQQEREAISTRTKEALKAAKARKQQLGGYRGGPVPDRSQGAAAKRAKADAFAARVRPTVNEMQTRGLSLRAMAAELSTRGIRTRRDRTWTATAVQRVIQRG